MGIQKISQGVTTYFFFAFNHEFHVTIQRICSHHIFKGFYVHEKLPFVITCSSGKNSSVRMLIGFFNHRFKRWRGPQVKRVWRLNIVMSINQNSGVIWVDQLFTIDNWMSWGLVYGCGIAARGF